VVRPRSCRVFITSTLLHLGEDINPLVGQVFGAVAGEVNSCINYNIYFIFSFHFSFYLTFISFVLFCFVSFSFLFFLLFSSYTYMRVWSCTLSGRLCRVSSSFSENMAEEDN
jgi:hypothetical protein